MTRLWAWLMHIVWATEAEAERYSRVDDELRRIGL